MKYRADIDGLRAVAVLPVLLFHAGVPGFGGGYVGVDVFFVISGFLITSMISEEMRGGDFSIARFYERRVRRIFPALFAVLAASSVAAWFVLTPADLKDFGQSVLATAGFGSNLLFWMQTDYFDGPAHLKPLLHTWSLAVEEQFYVAYPLLLAALFRWWRARASSVVVILLLGSFVLALATMLHRPATAFYLSPQRGWELLVGCVLALGVVRPVGSAIAREAMGAAGLMLIAGAVVAYSEKTPFPGVAALAPCLGAALVIHGGADGPTTAKRWLSSSPVVFVGKISYSLYLWHWPLLVFGGYLNTGRLALPVALSALFLSLVLSALSWRFIEQPVRHGALSRRRTLFGLAALVSVSAMILGASMHLSGGFPSRVDPRVLALDDARKDRSPDRGRCHASDEHPIPFDEKCRYGADGVPPSIAIWGDSFAVEPALVLGELAREKGLGVLFASYSACAPAIGIYEDRPPCEQHNRMMMSQLSASATIQTVMLFSRHERHFQEHGDRYLQGLASVVRELRQAGKRVVLSYPVPTPPAHVPTMLAQYAHLGRDPEAAFIQRSSFDEENAAIVPFLDQLVASQELIAARPADLLCHEDRCDLMADGQVLYFDEHHLSLAGVRRVMPAFRVAFEESKP